jgi:hypothetical protein
LIQSQPTTNDALKFCKNIGTLRQLLDHATAQVSSYLASFLRNDHFERKSNGLSSDSEIMKMAYHLLAAPRLGCLESCIDYFSRHRFMACSQLHYRISLEIGEVLHGID